MHAALRLLRLVLPAVLGCGLAFFATHGTALARSESCTVSGSIAFGNYNVYGSAVTSNGSISGTCAFGTGGDAANISITLGNGNNLQSDGNRGMKCTSCAGSFANDILQYQLYTSANLSTVWIGSVTMTTQNPCPCGSQSSNWKAVTIYGEIPAAVAGGVNDSAVGSYSDSVLVTLNF